MFGLFGGNRNPAFTPGIMPDEKAQKPDYGSARPKRSFRDKAFILGGMLQDLDWTTAGGKGQAAMNYVDGQLDQRYQDEERQRRVQAAIELAGGDPKLAAAARVSPDLVTQRYVNNNMQDPLAVKASQRADERLKLAQQGQEFQQGFALDGREYSRGRDELMDARYADNRDYTRGQDQLMWDYRDQRDARQDYVQDRNYGRGVLESDRNYGLAQNNAQFQQGMAMQKAQAEANKGPYSDAEVRQYRQRAGQLNQAESVFGNYLGMLEEHGKQSIPWNRERVAQMEGAYTAALMEAKNLFELGALSGPDLKLIQDIVPPPTGFGRDKNAVAKMQQAMSYIDNSWANVPPEFSTMRKGGQRETPSSIQEMSDEELMRIINGR